ncbi:hypothetical protein, variant [Capsaspora owczarzaki ATCC 30864]|uniref:Uncharacterized protein n=1 Tax=Capsaspora owczarzaki (strain ATCC 30864) TaxID=595528 RepID=A0A0D2WWY4_CAPO3|nr:hypothetical protein, variant [Capsaspora owczarzaki ATCC 30864]
MAHHARHHSHMLVNPAFVMRDLQIGDVEYFVDGHLFKFFVRPYFLRLNLPGECVENGKEFAQYDLDKGEILIQLPKRTHGEDFPDLDLLTALLAAPPTRTNTKRDTTGPNGASLITVLPDSDSTRTSRAADSVEPNATSSYDINDDADAEEEEEGEEEEEEEEDIDFSWPQKPTAVLEPNTGADSSVEAASASNELLRACYGFNLRHSDFFASLRQDFVELIELPDPDRTPAAQRRLLRLAAEDADFDEHHYVADYAVDDGVIPSLIEYEPWWHSLPEKKQDASASAPMANAAASTSALTAQLESLAIEQSPAPSQPAVVLTAEEKDILRGFRLKPHLLDNTPEERARLYAGLVDILCAFVYDLRVTEGEHNVESTWTIWKLSPSLSWLDSPDTVSDAAIAFMRRSLCYPLYRHFALSKKIVLQDVARLLRIGKRAVLRCLLVVQQKFSHDEERYLLCNIFLDDYCLWLQQSATDALLARTADELEQLSLTHELVSSEWDLKLLEDAADATEDSEEAIEQVSNSEHQPAGLDLEGDESEASSDSDNSSRSSRSSRSSTSSSSSDSDTDSSDSSDSDEESDGEADDDDAEIDTVE